MSVARQPVSPELREWLVTQLAAGHSVPSLRVSMQEAGWHDDVANAALTEIAQHAVLDVCEFHAPVVAVRKTAMPGPDLDASPLYLDGGDRRVHVLHTMKSPRVVVFGDLLSDDECAALVAASGRRLARSLTVETKTGGETLNVDRTSDGMFFERGENELISRIEQRIAKVLRWPVEFGEGLQVLRYGPGAEYKPHYDYFDPAEPGTPSILQRGGQRVATLVMYLQEPEQGGATTFPDVGLEVAPKRGTGVFFSYDRPDPDTRTLHGGAPVLAGQKWVATKWLREREFT